MMTMFRFLAVAALLCLVSIGARAQCVPNSGYPWPTNGCLKAADLNAEFASILANGAGTQISAPKPLGAGQDDRSAIQAFLTANCSKGPILFFGNYNIGYPGLVPPRNCVYGGATTYMASGSAISGYPAPTMFQAFGTWTDNLHCIINQTHDGQWVHDLTLSGLNVISPQVCGIRALNSVQWTWFNVNTYQAFRGKELIGDSNQPCGDSQCWTQAGEILFGSDVRNMAEGLLMTNQLPGEGASSSFVSDIIITGTEEENNCNATSSTRTDMAFLPSNACSGIGMYQSVAGILMSGNGRSEDEFTNNGAGSYGLIAFNTTALTITNLAFDLNQNAAMWLQNIDSAELNGINSQREQQLGPGTNCGHIRLTGGINDLRMGANFFDNSTFIFEGDKGATGFAPTMKYSSIQIALNDGTTTGFDNTGNKLYCPVSSDGVLAQTVVSPSVIGPANFAAFTPSNPTGTTSTTGLMMGLGSTVTLTPAKTGNIRVEISGNSTNAAAITAKFGTGTAPANAAAPSGTTVGVTALGTTFTISGMIPAAAVTVPVTPVWVDLDLAASSGTATVTNLSVSLTEQ